MVGGTLRAPGIWLPAEEEERLARILSGLFDVEASEANGSDVLAASAAVDAVGEFGSGVRRESLVRTNA